MLYPRLSTPRGSHRKDVAQMPPAATLGEARARHLWIWVMCPRKDCTMVLAVPLAPLIIRWGLDMRLDAVRRRARCTRCGRRGVRIREPSSEGGDRKCVPEMHRWTGLPNEGPRFGVPEMR